LNEEVDVSWEPIEGDTLGGNMNLSVADLAKIQYLFKD
jgi:hypothetical protein